MIQVFWRYVEYYKVQSSNSVDLKTDHCLINSSFYWDMIDVTMPVTDTFSKIGGDVDVEDGVKWWQGQQLYSKFAGITGLFAHCYY